MPSRIDFEDKKIKLWRTTIELGGAYWACPVTEVKNLVEEKELNEGDLILLINGTYMERTLLPIIGVFDGKSRNGITTKGQAHFLEPPTGVKGYEFPKLIPCKTMEYCYSADLYAGKEQIPQGLRELGKEYEPYINMLDGFPGE